MHLSDRALGNEVQLVRKLYDLSKAYDSVVDLTLGDPDIPTPPLIREAAERAMENNKTKYTANAGIPELREAISRDVAERTGIRYSADEITVTAGAMGALYLTSCVLLNPGDEIIVLEPHWPNYSAMVRMCGAVPRFVSFLGEENLRNLAENIRALVNGRTRAVIINSPSNPTGRVLPMKTLEEIAQIAEEADLTVITDEVYRTIVFDGSFRSMLEIPGMKERTVLIDSFSKRFSMTGFRVGFLCAPKEIALNAARLEENVNSCACQFAQIACTAALENAHALEKEISDIFERRCRAMARELQKSRRIRMEAPQSTFYLFPDITATGLSSEEFAYRLLREKQIALVPGNAFNKAGEGYIRIACTLPEEKLVSAVREIVEFADRE